MLFYAFFPLLLILASCQPDPTPKTPVETQTLRIAANEGPHSLDPRKGHTLADATVMNMLYEGLMRLTSEGIVPGMAESVSISDDKKTYTFHLREAKWLDGHPVTAQDFIYSWTSQLNPHFESTNAFFLYPIKNARAVKNGTCPAEHLSVKAADALTLVVELEEPTPYFLELTAFYPLFPVNSHNEEITNGPFSLVAYTPKHELTVTKNPHYWDSSSINLDHITIILVDEHTALNLFELGEIDWTGSPLSMIPSDTLAALAHSAHLQASPVAATHFLRFNIHKAPLDNAKLRQALSLAINRDQLIHTIIHGSQQPATSFIPSFPNWEAQHLFQDNDQQLARQLFQEALEESGFTIDSFPAMTLSFGYDQRNYTIAQAIQQQWYRVLGVWIDLTATEFKLFREKIESQDYFVAYGSWFADFCDPLNFLSVFENKDNTTNGTGWENTRYQELLRLSSRQEDPQVRKSMLNEAEQILIQDMPIAPLFFYHLNYLKSPNLKKVEISPTGIQIFRNGYFGSNP